MASSCLRAFAPSTSRSLSALKNSRSSFGRRALHMRRELPYPIEGGVGEFLPPPALKTLVEYQEGLLERLNQEVQTDPRAEHHSSVAQIAINYATLKERALGFNYAVLALNNSFFLDQIAPPPDDIHDQSSHESHISPNLAAAIAEHYGDLAHLKSTFSAAAMGMFSNGWVWLVADQDGNLGVLPTFGPSTLLVRMRRNMHPNIDLGVLGEGPQAAMNPNADALPSPFGKTSAALWGSSSGSSLGGTRTLHTSATARSMYDYSKDDIYGEDELDMSPVQGNKGTLLSVGGTLHPLLCLSVYEHAWMSGGYGVWGKEEWLKQFWKVVDWSKVSKAYARIR